jgi:hypothetical protein
MVCLQAHLVMCLNSAACLSTLYIAGLANVAAVASPVLQASKRPGFLHMPLLLLLLLLVLLLLRAGFTARWT